MSIIGTVLSKLVFAFPALGHQALVNKWENTTSILQELPSYHILRRLSSPTIISTSLFLRLQPHPSIPTEGKYVRLESTL